MKAGQRRNAPDKLLSFVVELPWWCRYFCRITNDSTVRFVTFCHVLHIFRSAGFITPRPRIYVSRLLSPYYYNICWLVIDVITLVKNTKRPSVRRCRVYDRPMVYFLENRSGVVFYGLSDDLGYLSATLLPVEDNVKPICSTFVCFKPCVSLRSRSYCYWNVISVYIINMIKSIIILFFTVQTRHVFRC